jgi:hypothetical protein
LKYHEWHGYWKYLDLIYYAWLHRLENPTDAEVARNDLEAKILSVHKESNGTYGSPRITAELHDRGEVISKNSVATL